MYLGVNECVRTLLHEYLLRPPLGQSTVLLGQHRDAEGRAGGWCNTLGSDVPEKGTGVYTVITVGGFHLLGPSSSLYPSFPIPLFLLSFLLAFKHFS